MRALYTLVARKENDYYDYISCKARERTVTTNTWTVAEAKAKLSEVIDRAKSGAPQIITRHGRMAVVVVAAEEWDRRTKRLGNLARFFAASPLPGSELDVERSRDQPRDIDL